MNLRTLDPKSSALPNCATFRYGADSGNRTSGLRVTNAVLCLLSYIGKYVCCWCDRPALAMCISGTSAAVSSCDDIIRGTELHRASPDDQSGARSRAAPLYGRSGANRTPIYGFGDRRSAFELRPCMVAVERIELPLPGSEPDALPLRYTAIGCRGRTRTDSLRVMNPAIDLRYALRSGAGNRNRTYNLPLTRRLLYQLSYAGMVALAWIEHANCRFKAGCLTCLATTQYMAEIRGFEPRHRLHGLSVFKTDPFNHLGISPCVAQTFAYAR